MIEVREVRKTFDAPKSQMTVAVDALSFSAEPGRVFAVLGPNGSGKTTLLRMLATLLNPDEGEIEVAGICVRKDPREVRRQLGFLTGSAVLHKKLTPAETLQFFASLQSIDKKVAKTRIVDFVEQFELGGFLHKPVGSLSLGQKQRVMIARTLLHDPQVVIFDEATAGLDVLAAKVLMQMIRDCKEAGKTVLFSTHIMGEVALVADDVMVMNQGRRCYLDSFENLDNEKQERSLEEEFVRLVEA